MCVDEPRNNFKNKYVFVDEPRNNFKSKYMFVDEPRNNFKNKYMFVDELRNNFKNNVIYEILTVIFIEPSFITPHRAVSRAIWSIRFDKIWMIA